MNLLFTPFTLPVRILRLLADPGIRAEKRRPARARSWAAAGMREALAVNRPLALVAAAMVPLTVLTVVGVLADPREITGAPAWMKPMKFAISIGIYAFTLLWLLGRVKGRPRLVWWTATLTAVALAVEWVAIALQASRGVRSHFNFATPLDGLLAGTMGLFVIVLWGMNVAAAILLLIQREEDRAFAWSLRLGLLIAVVGGAMGAAMLRPTPEQVAGMRSGQAATAIGAHAVGVADGGPGLPVVGWSTEGGDVRAPHFFGLHGLQLLPLVGWWLARWGRLRAGERLALVWTAGLGYLGFVLVLFWQALRGEPVIAPGAATTGALTALALAVVVSASAVLVASARRPPAPPASPAARGSARPVARSAG